MAIASEDYETVGGLLSGDIVRLTISGINWRVLKSHNCNAYEESPHCQKVVNQYELQDPEGNKKFAAVLREFGFCPGLGLSQEVEVLGLEDTLELSQFQEGFWRDNLRTAS